MTEITELNKLDKEELIKLYESCILKKEKAKEYRKNYFQENREKYNEYLRKYYHEKRKNDPEHKEYMRQVSKKFYDKKKDDPEFKEKCRIKEKAKYQDKKLKNQELLDKVKQLEEQLNNNKFSS